MVYGKELYRIDLCFNRHLGQLTEKNFEKNFCISIIIDYLVLKKHLVLVF